MIKITVLDWEKSLRMPKIKKKTLSKPFFYLINR